MSDVLFLGLTVSTNCNLGMSLESPLNYGAKQDIFSSNNGNTKGNDLVVKQKKRLKSF